jgi:hypothetical protein
VEHRAILVQSWFTIGMGILFTILGLVFHWTETAGSTRIIATFAFIVVGSLGIITANSVRRLEERIAALEGQRMQASQREEQIV